MQEPHDDNCRGWATRCFYCGEAIDGGPFAIENEGSYKDPQPMPLHVPCFTQHVGPSKPPTTIYVRDDYLLMAQGMFPNYVCEVYSPNWWRLMEPLTHEAATALRTKDPFSED
jgi:hypothetical protein